MFDITTRASVDAALIVRQLDALARLAEWRKAVEQMQWITAQGSAARILGALADGVSHRRFADAAYR